MALQLGEKLNLREQNIDHNVFLNYGWKMSPKNRVIK